MLPKPHLRDLVTARGVVAFCFIAAVTACAGPSTTVDQVWTSPVARAEPPLQKVATIFITDNLTMRHAGEDRLARDLAARGVTATPAYAIFRDGAQTEQELPAIKAKLREMGYDGVVTMRIVDREQQLEAVPGTFDAYWGYWGGGYWGGPGWGAYSPGYLYTETIYKIETAAYSLRDGRLVWSAVTRTVDPTNADEMVEQTTQLVAGQLVGSGLAG